MHEEVQVEIDRYDTEIVNLEKNRNFDFNTLEEVIEDDETTETEVAETNVQEPETKTLPQMVEISVELLERLMAGNTDLDAVMEATALLPTN